MDRKEAEASRGIRGIQDAGKWAEQGDGGECAGGFPSVWEWGRERKDNSRVSV